MAFSQCLTEIEQAVGRALSDDEMDDLLTGLQRRAEKKQRLGEADSLNDAVRDAADDFAAEMAEEAVIQKRNAAINLRRRLEIIDYVKTQFPDNPILGLEAVLVGVNAPRAGARFSAGAQQTALAKKYLGGLFADLEQQGLFGAFTSNSMDREIARAMWARNRETTLPVDVPKEAATIADVLTKWQEVARLDANKAGAFIKRMPGYIVRQSHDMWRIRRAGFDAWRAEILPRLDLDRTMEVAPNMDPTQFLQGVFDGLVSGVHLKSQPHPGFTGPRNIAKKASAERVLHFKSADDWFEYNQRFGVGTLSSAVVRGLDLSAQTTGLMKTLGTNPEANLRQVADRLMRDVPATERGEISKALQSGGRLANQMAELDGTTRMPVNAMAARISGSIRAVQNMAKLGAAFFSQFSDIAIRASTMRFQGQNFLGAIGDGVVSVGRGFRGTERAEISGMLEVFSESMRGTAATSRHSPSVDDLPGALAWMQQAFFKLNLMQGWTDRVRAGVVDASARQLAMNKNVGFAALNADLKRVLGTYAIGEPEWNILRQASRDIGGKEYVVAEAVRDISDEQFASILRNQGVNPTTRRVADLKEEIADKLRAFYSDRSDIAVSIPDARTRAFLIRGTRPGTLWGEFARFVGQFKSFPTGVVMNQLGRELFGRGANTLGEALRGGRGEMVGLAQLMLTATAFGYIAMSAKDLAKGRNPRDPSDPKTWAAAFVQGGGAGIYGDFLFGEVRNRFGGTFVSTLAGPTAGAVDDLADLWGRLRAGDDTAAAAFRTLLSNTPGANLFYTRIALDYLFLWRIQETLSPGSLKRLEGRIEKENAQTYLIRPSEVAR